MAVDRLEGDQGGFRGGSAATGIPSQRSAGRLELAALDFQNFPDLAQVLDPLSDDPKLTLKSRYRPCAEMPAVLPSEGRKEGTDVSQRKPGIPGRLEQPEGVQILT